VGQWAFSAFPNQDTNPVFVDCYTLMCFIYREKRGRAFAAIREDELAADAMGINPTYYKVLAFTLGAILAGVVGALSAHFLILGMPAKVPLMPVLFT